MDQFTRAVLRRAALPTAVVGLAVTAATWVGMGSAAGIGALLATAIVVVFFLVGQVVLGRILTHSPELGLTAAMTLYLLKIGVLLMLLVLLKGTTAFDTKIFAVTILACTLVWTIAEVWTFSRSRVLVIEPGSGPGSTPSDT